jgi:para-nitrobenzyl esterase
MQSPSRNRIYGARLAATLQCGQDRAACLRGQPRHDLLKATEGTGLDAFLNPAYDTALLPRNPAQALRFGAFHRMPVLSGSTRDEHRSLIADVDLTTPVTPKRYAGVVTAAFPGRAAQVLAEYPVEAYPSPAAAWAAVATDRIWVCPTLTGDRLLARHTPTYGYEFAERHGVLPSEGYPWGAYHGSELPFLFDVEWLPSAPQPALADRMIDAWARFAATGRPGWPRLETYAATPYVRILANAGDGSADLAAEHHCGFWARG